MGLKRYFRNALGIEKLRKELQSALNTHDRVALQLERVNEDRDRLEKELSVLSGAYQRLEAPLLRLIDTLYLNADAFLQFELNLGKSRDRIILVTQPKSGTYFIGALLEELGLVSCGVHISETCFTDYRKRTIREMVEL